MAKQVCRSESLKHGHAKTRISFCHICVSSTKRKAFHFPIKKQRESPGRGDHQDAHAGHSEESARSKSDHIVFWRYSRRIGGCVVSPLSPYTEFAGTAPRNRGDGDTTRVFDPRRVQAVVSGYRWRKTFYCATKIHAR